MTFLDVLNQIDIRNFADINNQATKEDVRRVLGKNRLTFDDYLILLSDQAGAMLEELAQKSRELTLKHFGRTILLYVPLYLSNECDNNCVYCGFSQKLPEKRVTLTVDQVLQEAEILYQKGFRHVLLVAGEKRDKVTQNYLKEVITRLHEKFESICLEIFPLTEEEYVDLYRAGADGVTLYQEVYDRSQYEKVHLNGPKSDYENRLLVPERAGRTGYYRINIGTLLGLNKWFNEAAWLGLHAAYLKKHFWKTQIAVSFPRLKVSAAKYVPSYPVSDQQLVQMICALRIFIPTLGLVLSTRENASLRDNLIPLGITQMSAESKTSPGGYALAENAEEQFKVTDTRNLGEIIAAINKKGYDSVRKDWDRVYL